MKNNNSATWVEEFDPKFDQDAERRIQAEIKALRSEERAEKVRHLPLSGVLWVAKAAALVIAVGLMFVAFNSLLSLTTAPPGTQSSIPRQR